MAKIIKNAEENFHRVGLKRGQTDYNIDTDVEVTYSTVNLSDMLGAKLIVCVTDPAVQ